MGPTNDDWEVLTLKQAIAEREVSLKLACRALSSSLILL
jgi:hypothetical protein